jgi:hypothetical protein
MGNSQISDHINSEIRITALLFVKKGCINNSCLTAVIKPVVKIAAKCLKCCVQRTFIQRQARSIIMARNTLLPFHFIFISDYCLLIMQHSNEMAKLIHMYFFWLLRKENLLLYFHLWRIVSCDRVGFLL